jgi:hypothetical protein
MEPTISSNLLETIPREILFEILKYLQLRGAIRTLTILDMFDDETADYICPRVHRINFRPVLDMITAIKYKIKAYHVFPPDSAYRHTGVSIRENCRARVMYYPREFGLNVVSVGIWPRITLPTSFLVYDRKSNNC